eukprot:3968104-Amphidinium_carterae.1
MRIKTIVSFRKLAEALADEEIELHRSLNPDVRRVLDGKRILLLRALFTKFPNGDANLIDDLISGFRMI